MRWIGIDAHKSLHQAAALGPDGAVTYLAVPNTPAGWVAVQTWAHAWPERIWAIEGSGSLGRGLAQFLAAQGERVHEVSPKWTAQRRRTMRRPGKSDRLDAHAVAQVLREETATLPVVQPEEEAVALVQLWSRLRADLVTELTRIRNRLHALLLLCDPEYKLQVPALTTAAGIQACRQYTAPSSGRLAREREQAVRHLADQLVLLTEQERVLRRKLEAVIADRFAPLTRIDGVGPIIAAGLIAELGAPRPGFGEAQLAALAGVAPLEASSAGGVRHRLNRQGNRRLNSLLHHITLVQARVYPPAQAYLARRRQQGRTAREARRALKRQLVRRLWRQWQSCWPNASPPLSLTLHAG